MIISQNMFCQQQPYYLFFKQNMSVINPAATGVEGPLIGLNLKSSMIGVEGAPSLQSLVYHSNFNRNASWGISIQNEKVNIESSGAATIDYSYRLQFSDDIYLNLGIKGGMFFNNIDINSIERVTPEANSALSLVNNYSNPIIGLGAFFKGKNYYIAISANNLLNSNRYKEENGIVSQAIDNGQIYTSFGFDLKITESVSFSPSIIYSLAKDIDNQMVILSNFNIGESISLGIGTSSNDNNSFQALFKGFRNIDFGVGYEMRPKNSLLNSNNIELYLGYKLNADGARKPSWERRN